MSYLKQALSGPLGLSALFLALVLLAACNNNQTGMLEAFEQNHWQLRQSTQMARLVSAQIMTNMREVLKEKADSLALPDDSSLTLVDTLNALDEQTQFLVKILDGHLAVMEDLAGLDPETGLFSKKGEKERAYVYWLEEDRAGQLKKEMLGYDSLLRAWSGGVLKPDNGPAKKGIWEQFSERRPVISHMAVLEGMKTGVFHQERELLNIYNGRLEVPYYRPNQLLALEVPESRVLTAGETFRTRLSVGYSSDQLRPRFVGDGVVNDTTGSFASLSVAADGAKIPEGQSWARQYYSATIHVPKYEGGFIDLPVDGNFIVRRPEIVTTASPDLFLFRQCANVLRIAVPDLHDQYSPHLLMQGGSYQVLSDSQHTYVIIPRSDSCVITVNNQLEEGEVKIGELAYRVIDPPKPSLFLVINDKAHNGISPIPRSSRIMLYIQADGTFKSAMPNDARYGVTSVDVLAQFTLGPPEVVNTVSGMGKTGEKGIPIALGEVVRNAIPGTRIYIRVNEIYRKNFKGEDLPDTRFSEVERTIGMVVR